MIRKLFMIMLILAFTLFPIMGNGQTEESGSKDLTIWSFNLSAGRSCKS